MMPGMALHLLYGVGTGVAFVVFASALGYGLESLTSAIPAVIVYAVLLTLFGSPRTAVR